jgi:hypothetical protein
MAAVALALAVAGPAFAAEPCREAQADRCELFDGVSYRRIVRSAPTARVTHVVEIDLTRPGLRLALTPGDSSRGLEYIARTTSEQLDRSGALVAVNASYFLPFFGGTPGNNDFFPQASDPSDVSGASLAGGISVSAIDTTTDQRVDSIACFAPGKLAINAGQSCPAGFTDGVAAGPRLLAAGARVRPPFPPPVAGQAVPPPMTPTTPTTPRGGPRTAIGVSADGRRGFLVVVDGRQPGYSMGASHDELTSLFVELGAHDAMSLDGGGSATLAARGPRSAIVLNRPIHTGVPGRERPVANHVLLLAEAPHPAADRPTPAARRSSTSYAGPVVQRLRARLDRIYQAEEARQGVAVDDRHFYAVVNSAIGQYEIESGRRIAGWAGPRDGLIRHLNACLADAGRLYCANSNFPETPMGSSIEIFDTTTLTHVQSHSLGLTDEGSLTFLDRLGQGWLTGFAHYDGRGGAGFKGSAYSSIVMLDAEWRRVGGWLIPASVQERMAPQAASGGALGPDGLLYLFGHTKPEMYVFAKPAMGPVLLHLATIELEAAGQAFVFDRSAPRTIYAIDRPSGTVRRFLLPEVQMDHPDARRFAAPGPVAGTTRRP